MNSDEEDKIIRILTRSSLNEVRESVFEYKKGLSKRSQMSDPKLRRILKDHGWTLLEFCKASAKLNN